MNDPDVKILQTEVDRIREDLKALTNPRHWLAVAITLAAIFGISAGGMFFRVWRVWPLVDRGQMEVTLKSVQYLGQRLLAQPDGFAVIRPTADKAH